MTRPMPRQNNAAATGGLSFPTALFLIFLILKLVDQIDWSWWLVFAPLWVPAGIGLIGVGMYLLANLIEKAEKKRRKRS